MKKKTYFAPLTITFYTEMESHLMDASIPKGTDGPNIPEAKGGFFDDDESDMPLHGKSIWDESGERDEFWEE